MTNRRDHRDRPDAPADDAVGCLVHVRFFTGSGLVALGLVAGGLGLMAHTPGGVDPAPGRFLREPSPVTTLAFAPVGRTLALDRGDGALDVRDLARGRSLRVEDGPCSPALSVAFSPDGRTLARAGPGPEVRLRDAATGAPLATLVGHSRSACSVAFSPDGRTLATGGQDSLVGLFDLTPGAPGRHRL